MQTKKRIDWIDMAKGCGILLVIMGHCFNKGTPIHNWIFSFHMPLFFILSGYCFHIEKYQSFAAVFRDKFRRLIVPYLGFCALGGAVSLLIPQWRGEFTARQVFVDIYCAYPTLVHITSIWYLAAVFILSLLLYLVVTLSEKYRARWFPYAFVAASGCMGYLITVVRKLFFTGTGQTAGGGSGGGLSLPGGRMPLTLDTCMTALVFFYLGYRIQKRRAGEAVKTRRIPVFLALAAVHLVTALALNERVNLHGCTFGNPLYFYVAAIAGSFAVCILMQELEKAEVLRRILVFYGKNSLLILGLQSLLLHLYLLALNESTGGQYELYENIPTLHGWVMFVTVTAAVTLLLLAKQRLAVRKNEGTRKNGK